MKQQRGISLIVVLIGLIIISFAAVALLRSTDTATLIAGNLGFKRAALASGDAGTEAAIKWLSDNAVAAGFPLQSDGGGDGYYATSRDACDLTGSLTPDLSDDDVDWTGSGLKPSCNMEGHEVSPKPAGVAADYTVSYIINRMCNAEGDSASALSASGGAMICSASDAGEVGASTQVGPTYSRRPFTGSGRAYYRITTRIAGPRETVRYVQAFIVM